MTSRFKVRIFLFSTMATVILITSCSQKQATEPNYQSGAIIPLKVSNVWRTQSTFFDSLCNSLSSRIDTFYVVRDTLIDNERWFTNSSLPHTSYHFTNRSDGHYHRYQDYSSPTLSIFLMWKYPASMNDSFYIPDTYSYTIVTSISDEVTVKAGSFNCYQYRWRYNNWPGPNEVYREQAWLSPNVGDIKHLGYIKLPSGREYLYYASELVSYRLN